MNVSSSHQAMLACARLERLGCHVVSAHSINGTPTIQARPARINATALAVDASLVGVRIQWRIK